mmetsp:Transcript_1709/g.2336  ORF Transcript_1709/g.2336 Transcript_1709/m.2336 type:complete len:391 (+) Transcript_1709:228-1400(+)
MLLIVTPTEDDLNFLKASLRKITLLKISQYFEVFKLKELNRLRYETMKLSFALTAMLAPTLTLAQDEERKLELTQGTDSCTGYRACIRTADNNGLVFMGDRSCNGDHACSVLGKDHGDVILRDGACNDSTNGVCRRLGWDYGNVINGDNSFVGTAQECGDVGSGLGNGLRRRTGFVRIGAGSCTGQDGAPGTNSCYQMGNQGAKVTIGDGSCIGESAPCYRMGNEEADLSIADNSCIGRQSCMGMTTDGATMTVGTDSCVGHGACYRIAQGKSNQVVAIGDHSCKCDHCCRCLYLSWEPFITIPDNSINSMGTGLDSICKGVDQINEAALSMVLVPPPAPVEPTAYSNALTSNNPGFNGDPIIIGLQDQVVKFLGRDDAWYSFLSTDALQ